MYIYPLLSIFPPNFLHFFSKMDTCYQNPSPLVGLGTGGGGGLPIRNTGNTRRHPDETGEMASHGKKIRGSVDYSMSSVLYVYRYGEAYAGSRPGLRHGEHLHLGDGRLRWVTRRVLHYSLLAGHKMYLIPYRNPGVALVYMGHFFVKLFCLWE
jgi:hypothetical protein